MAAPSPKIVKFIVFSGYLTIRDSAKYHRLTYTEKFHLFNLDNLTSIEYT